jgi:hypothetical protein
MDTTQFGGTFWITISGMTLGFLATAGIYCLKAKCNQVSLCWGLIKVKRDVNAEVRENTEEIEHGINPYQFQTQNYIPANMNSSTPTTNSTNNQPTTNPLLPAPTNQSVPAPTNQSVPAPTNQSVPAPTNQSVPAPINNI